MTRLENVLYPVLDNAPETARDDLVAVLLTGIPGLNFTGERKADLLRLNTAIPPSGPVGSGDRLGVLAGDFAGFPNGRRLEDDVADIELRAFACGYGPVAGPLVESFGFCGGNANRTPNNLLGDGVDARRSPVHRGVPISRHPAPGLRASTTTDAERAVMKSMHGRCVRGLNGSSRQPLSGWLPRWFPA